MFPRSSQTLRCLLDAVGPVDATGKTSSNATLGDNQIMLDTIRDHFLAIGTEIAMKPARRYPPAKQALQLQHGAEESVKRVKIHSPETDWYSRRPRIRLADPRFHRSQGCLASRRDLKDSHGQSPAWHLQGQMHLE